MDYREDGDQITDAPATCLNGTAEDLTLNSTGQQGSCNAPEHIKAFDAVKSDAGSRSAGTAGRTAAVITALLAAAALIFFLCYYNLPSNRYKRVMKAAAGYLNEQETVLAAEFYRKALELMPGSEEAEGALYGIWSRALDEIMELADRGSFKDALLQARKLPQIDPERSVMNRSAIAVIYKQWVCALAESNDAEGIRKLLSDASEDLSGEEIEQVRQEASRAEEYYRILRMLNEKAEEIILLDREGNISEVFAKIPALAEMTDRYIDLGGNAPFIFGHKEGEQLGYFFSGLDVFVVIGKLERTGIAEGEATAYYVECLGTEDEYLYRYTSDWRDGRPNGYCEYSEMSGGMTENRAGITMTGVLSGGDWDGEVEETYTDGETYTITFVKGYVEIIEKEDADLNLVGYNKGGNKKRYYSDQEASHEYGVPYMYYN